MVITQTHLTALCPGLPGWAGTRKVKPIWILLKQETVSGSGISWAVCKSAARSRQITTPAPHQSVFYRPDALPAAQPWDGYNSCQWKPNTCKFPVSGKGYTGKKCSLQTLSTNSISDFCRHTTVPVKTKRRKCVQKCGMISQTLSLFTRQASQFPCPLLCVY